MASSLLLLMTTSDNLRRLCDEVFGEENFIATSSGKRFMHRKIRPGIFSEDHDYIVVYARNAATLWQPELLAEDRGSRRPITTNPDNDPRGPWNSADLRARNYYSKGTIRDHLPVGEKIVGPPAGRYWRVVVREILRTGSRTVESGGARTGRAIACPKRFLSEVKQGRRTADALAVLQDVGHTQGRQEGANGVRKIREYDNVLDSRQT